MMKTSNFTRLSMCWKRSDADDGTLLVAYRRRLKANGKYEPMFDDDEYPIHIQDIVKMTEEYAKLHPEQ